MKELTNWECLLAILFVLGIGTFLIIQTAAAFGTAEGDWWWIRFIFMMLIMSPLLPMTIWVMEQIKK